MAFWDITIQFFWRDESLPVLILALCFAFLAFHFLADERKSVINTFSFFFVCLAGQFFSALLHALQFSNAAGVLHEAFIIGSGIALIRLFGLLLFRIVLPLYVPERTPELGAAVEGHG